MKWVILVLLFFIFFIMGCTKYGVENFEGEYDKMLTAKVKVTELNKDRTHSFVYYFDKAKDIAAVKGGFVIDGREYPGKIVYMEDKSILFKPKPDQCIVFPRNYMIYGFLPPNAVLENDYDNLSFEVTLNSEDKSGFSMNYTVFSYDTLQNSVVEVSYLKYVRYKSSYFEIPEDIVCFDYDNLIKI